ncbi:hypothetical protein [Bauldia litoralis]|nr:hypothetical protein [Bauldia litoralis]
MNDYRPQHQPPNMPTCAAPDNVGGVPSCGADKWWDLEVFLPIELIREHTKTDDVPQVSDEQLNLYRKAAVEAAEQYTGMVLAGQRTITEPVEALPRRSKFGFMKPSYRFQMAHPSVDGIVYLYGGSLPPQQLRIKPGAQVVSIAVDRYVIDLRQCCDPCGQGAAQGVNPGLMIMYKSGFAACEDIPAGIILGCLKFIAFSVMHAGDEILTVRNRASSAGTALEGTNNVGWASGGIELWRQYGPEAA